MGAFGWVVPEEQLGVQGVSCLEVQSLGFRVSGLEV